MDSVLDPVRYGTILVGNRYGAPAILYRFSIPCFYPSNNVKNIDLIKIDVLEKICTLLLLTYNIETCKI